MIRDLKQIPTVLVKWFFKYVEQVWIALQNDQAPSSTNF